MLQLLLSTRNRAGVLARSLNALCALAPPEGGYAILAVDNGSEDETGAVLAAFENRLPLERLFEIRPGKNIALNRALDHLGARIEGAELVVFCDDDILPERDWLIRLEEAARRYPETDLFGGEITIAWTSPPPPWLEAFRPHFGLLFAETGAAEGACAPEALWGPNLAIRGSAFCGGLRFNPGFGPNGSQDYAMGSETELLSRLGGLGLGARMVGQAGVGHMIDGEAVTRAWIFRRAARHGRGMARRLGRAAPGLQIFGVRLASWRGFAASGVKALFSKGEARDRALFGFYWHRGAIYEGFSRPVDAARPSRPQ